MMLQQVLDWLLETALNQTGRDVEWHVRQREKECPLCAARNNLIIRKVNNLSKLGYQCGCVISSPNDSESYTIMETCKDKHSLFLETEDFIYGT